MKVFLSWSGSRSHKVACVFRDWLPSVLQYVRPYVSSEDIDKGARWSTDIAKELEASSFGILCITKENLDGAWINFEAGALSKAIDKSHVSPFLFGLKRSEVEGPLLQFQSTVNEREDILKLLVSINRNATDAERLDESRIPKVFEVWWPQLQEQLAHVPSPPAEKDAGVSRPEAAAGSQTKILEELLELARIQHKLLRSPNELLPPDYLAFAFRDARVSPSQDRAAFAEVYSAIEHLRRQATALNNVIVAVKAQNGGVSSENLASLVELAEKIDAVSAFIAKHTSARRKRNLDLDVF